MATSEVISADWLIDHGFVKQHVGDRPRAWQFDSQPSKAGDRIRITWELRTNYVDVELIKRRGWFWSETLHLLIEERLMTRLKVVCLALAFNIPVPGEVDFAEEVKNKATALNTSQKPSE